MWGFEYYEEKVKRFQINSLEMIDMRWKVRKDDGLNIFGIFTFHLFMGTYAFFLFQNYSFYRMWHTGANTNTQTDHQLKLKLFFSFFTASFFHISYSNWRTVIVSFFSMSSSLIYIFHSVLGWSVEKNISFCRVVTVECFCISVICRDFFFTLLFAFLSYLWRGFWTQKFSNNAENNLLYNV